MPYLIDGHNLIPKTGLQLDAPDDEMELVMLLQEYLRRSRREADVYFDGAPPGEARSQRFGRLTAHFVPLGTTADSAIEQHLRNLGPGARNWIVVSSDRQLRNAARAARARSVTSEEFAEQLKGMSQAKAGLNSSAETMRDEELRPEEIDDWLRLFRKRD